MTKRVISEVADVARKIGVVNKQRNALIDEIDEFLDEARTQSEETDHQSETQTLLNMYIDLFFNLIYFSMHIALLIENIDPI